MKEQTNKTHQQKKKGFQMSLSTKNYQEITSLLPGDWEMNLKFGKLPVAQGEFNMMGNILRYSSV